MERAFTHREASFRDKKQKETPSAQTVDKVGAGIIPSTTFLYIAILLPKILISSRILVF